MNRRRFLLGAGLLGAGLALAGWRGVGGVANACLAGLPAGLAAHPLLEPVWNGLDFAQVWDGHAHLVGVGDSGEGAWSNPALDDPAHPLQYLQKRFYLNASCVEAASGGVDAAYVARLTALADQLPEGFKVLLYAFDWARDAAGRPEPANTAFRVADSYAAAVVATRPERFEWAASIHPYRPDALEALDWAARQGARAVKWLPAAQGMDPASPRCDAFYAALARHDLPLISHAGKEQAVTGAARQDYGNPLRLRRPLEAGVRVIVAHCASHGRDRDLDRGAAGPDLPSFALFARLMDTPAYRHRLYADISALTQFNRLAVLEQVLLREDWHDRLLNGSDYPLPGVTPLVSLELLRSRGLLPAAAPRVLGELRRHNALLFDFALKRLLSQRGVTFPASVFQTRRHFTRSAA